MLIDGEKYACDACVRGHRVSSCNHSERPLQHINKKGRPVSQCPHCRGLRKSRSTHIKCECGDKNGNGSSDKHDIKNELHNCSCMNGQRCNCALKKDYLEAVPENPLPNRTRSRANTDSRKPRLSATYSDPSITHFANGHHKPVHRHNHAGQECAPYKIPRPHSIHGPSSLFHQSFSDAPSNESSNTYVALLADKFSSLRQEDQRLVRSAQGSPGLNPLAKFEQFNNIPSLDLSYPAYNTSLTSSPAAEEYPQNYQPFDSYASTAEDQAPLSAPLAGPSYGWSALDLPLDGGAFNSASSQPPSYASLDQSHLSRPGLTSASSADVSEIGDYAAPQNGVPSPGFAEGSPYMPSPVENQPNNPSSGHNPNANSIAPGNQSYSLSNDPFPTTTSSSMGMNSAAAAAPSLASLTVHTPPFDTSSVESFLPPSQPSGSPFDPTDLSIKPPNSESFTHHGLTVRDAQKMAHPSGLGASDLDYIVPTPAAKGVTAVRGALGGMGGAEAMTSAPTSDPLWAATFSGVEDDGDFPVTSGREWMG